MKHKIWRWLVAAAVVLLAAMAVVPALRGRHEAEATVEKDITINLVYAFQNRQWSACVEEVVRQFEQTHPGVHIAYEIQYEDEVYEDTLTKLVARDELGDIVQLKEPLRFAKSGLFAPLPEALCAQVDTVCRVDGQPYAAAALGVTTGVVYNKALFRDLGLEPPASYEEFLTLCAALRRQGVTPLGVGGGDLWHMEYWLNHFLRSDVLSREPDFLAQCKAGERDWSDPLITEMLEHLAQLFRRGYVDSDWLNTPDAALAYHGIFRPLAYPGRAGAESVPGAGLVLRPQRGWAGGGRGERGRVLGRQRGLRPGRGAVRGRLRLFGILLFRRGVRGGVRLHGRIFHSGGPGTWAL